MKPLLSVVPLLLLAAAAMPAAKSLDVYVIDVEGGKAMLTITPAGQSLLVDAGWPGYENRDVDRIVAAVKAAGLKQIDYLLITHYDLDHMGDVPLLMSRIPVMHILDNGPLATTGKGVEERYRTYAAAREKIPHTVVHAGDLLPLKGVEIRAITAGAKHIPQVPGKGIPNPFCATSEERPAIPEDQEDEMSIGLLYTYGKFRMLDLADLEWHSERELMCPVNPIGAVDVYVTSVHAQSKAGSPALVHALHPRVVLMNNGPRKGGSAEAWAILHTSPGLKDIWQSHRSEVSGPGGNPPDDFIANVEAACKARWLKLSVRQNGSFSVENSRLGFVQQYGAGAGGPASQR